jgi:hypothetical protein
MMTVFAWSFNLLPLMILGKSCRRPIANQLTYMSSVLVHPPLVVRTTDHGWSRL